MNAYPAIATAFASMPATPTALIPYRFTSGELRGANTNWASANGTASAPASSGL